MCTFGVRKKITVLHDLILSDQFRSTNLSGLKSWQLLDHRVCALDKCWVCMMMGFEILGTPLKHPVQAEKFLAAPHSN
jgi:hypothetical protein